MGGPRAAIPFLTGTSLRGRPMQRGSAELQIQIILSMLELCPMVNKAAACTPKAVAELDSSADGKMQTKPTIGTEAEGEVDVCTICLCGYDESETFARVLPCTHSFHPECIEMWYRSGRSLDGACPVCKQPLVHEHERESTLSDNSSHTGRETGGAAAERPGSEADGQVGDPSGGGTDGDTPQDGTGVQLIVQRS